MAASLTLLGLAASRAPSPACFPCQGSALSVAQRGYRLGTCAASVSRPEVFGFPFGTGNSELELSKLSLFCQCGNKKMRSEEGDSLLADRAGLKRSANWSCCHIQRRTIVAEATSTQNAVDVDIPEKSVSVILLAGGKGNRMGANMPKQYLPLLGQPIALHSFHTFADMPEIFEIVVVCDPSYRDLFHDANVSIPLKFALPGKERQDSVQSGLREISKSSKLACIHDSARPLVLPEDILKVMKDAWTSGAAVLGVPVKATIKEAGADRLVSKTLNRSKLWEIQTPQVIEPELLRRGFELVEREGFEVTDDVSIVEYLEHPVLITKGSYTNLKVTTPDDLLIAERMLHQRTHAPASAPIAVS